MKVSGGGLKEEVGTNHQKLVHLVPLVSYECIILLPGYGPCGLLEQNC